MRRNHPEAGDKVQPISWRPIGPPFRIKEKKMTTKKSGKPSRAAAVKVAAAVLALFSLFGFFTASAEAKVLKINEAIYMAPGRGATDSNTFLVVTNQGNVIIDTSGPRMAAEHRKELKAVSAGPVKFIILTHGHGDHRGGVGLWREEGTQIVAQRNYPEFLHYQKRLAGHFQRMNAAQFSGQVVTRTAPSLGNYAAEIDATILYDETYEFSLGGIDFKLIRTPGETYDHTTVYIPQYQAVFCGDNYYGAFPNLYTLRGTKPRWALDWAESVDKALKLNPEILLPSHGGPISGRETIAAKLAAYRDAILYVHDETVKGMNEGKDVYTLMQEIRLPAGVDIPEGYGEVAWSVRGIYDGYVGWFDANPATMYALPPRAVYPDLVELAGGPDRVAARAVALIEKGEPVRGLHLTDVALAADPGNRAALEARLKALRMLLLKVRSGPAKNIIEEGWLNYGIRAAERRLDTGR
jgi:alkyl sulfatase BDS1-like metallo-beta-lactamase superfamily hydrolase